ncbi:MAG: hypothetical protein OXI77_14105 [Chloroflexota bacterium]|nr:hypothetical protein [Chloroflexota bacterium]MDE2910860.1 hypothetical protein [Chloroflexota bacterium]
MNKTTKTFTYIIGIVMTVAMVGSLILPMISSQVGLGDSYIETPQPTPFPEPTMPPPPDTAAIDFENRYLHRSGLFTIGAPTGWQPATDSNTVDELRAGLNNIEAQSVVELRISKNFAGVADADSLSAFIDDAWLGHTWSGYSGWDETGRKIVGDEVVQIDFNLRRGRSNLIARQESWIEAGDIYSARVVTAENASQALKFLLGGLASSVERVSEYADPPYDWDAYFDNLDKHMVRFPSSWEVADAAPGLPATIKGDSVVLVISTLDVALASEDEAVDWAENWRAGVKAGGAEAVDVAGAAGYKVSYRLSTLDGAVASGMMIMLHGTDNRLHVANIRMPDLDEDLLDADPAEYPWLAVVDSFRLLPNLEVSLQ